METTRKIIAAIVGIIVVIVLILLARFVGDQVRQRFFQSTSVVEQTVAVPKPKPTSELVKAPTPSVTDETGSTTEAGKGKGKGVTTIPATGPREDAMMAMGLVFLTGVSLVALSKKFVYTV